ncbi:hypothetical protein FEK30_01285 [Picosynechococcus sp. PCC 11901]|uniref:DUF5331 domain-containing protein n=1 Tax=Picosynechococcus sp. PCC 11901 TaxID=2579791 RepID=UPI0010FC2FF5|nr:DUF5331 domain-containing protein [Picosynechococcus sp. PCC 11901]QCS48176.1 hypothetical protein FEK30_01285 [Picosynechococcus sp. PCC 11901]
MSFFEQIKPSIKTKWLDYFENNQDWLNILMDRGESVATPDGGRRPQGSVILGAISAKEPRLAESLYLFSLVEANFDTIVDVLGLNFDPLLELRNLEEKGAAAKPMITPPTPAQISMPTE